MAKDVRFLISANVDRAEQEIRKLQGTGKAVSDSLGSAFEQLGIRSTVAIEKEKAAAVAAYDRIKASGVASATEIGRAKAALTTTTARLDRENLNLDRSINSVKKTSEGLSFSMAQLAGAAGMGMYIKSCIDAALAAERVSTAMKAVAGSSQASARELQYVREEAQRLGLNFIDLAGSYSKFSASTKNTVVEGEATRKIFSGVSEVVTALKLSGDQANGIFKALSQMMSKGKVSAEELTQQLGEHLPGSTKLAADALGLTTAELLKQMEQGKIMSSDLLPKLAAEMHKTYGVAAKEAAEGGQAEINRFNNTVQESKRLLGEVFLPTLVEVLKTFNSGASVMKPVIESLQSAYVSLTGFVDKYVAFKDAGGWGALFTAESRNELKQQLKAIDDVSDWNKNKIHTRLNPNISSQKTPQELAAENARVADAAAKEAAAKAKAAAEKLAKEQEEYDKLIKEREINRLKDQHKIKQDILSADEKFANSTLHALQAKKKEIQELQSSFLESDRSFAEQRAQVLGDFSGGFAHLDPNATAQQKAASLQDRLIEQEKEYQQLSDPKDKQQKLAGLADEWGQLTTKIDFANMSQAEKMMQISRIEEERARLQNSVMQNAEAEKKTLADTYDLALVKIREYKTEVQALDALIKNMSREITIDMKINKAGLELVKAGGSISGGGSVQSAATGATAGGINDFSGTGYGGYSPYGAAGSYNSRHDSYSPGLDSLPDGYISISSLPSYAVGTNYVPRTGPALIHQGEKITPASQNNGSDGAITIAGGITIQVQGGTSDAMLDEFARKLVPRMQQLQSRFRKAA